MSATPDHLSSAPQASPLHLRGSLEIAKPKAGARAIIGDICHASGWGLFSGRLILPWSRIGDWLGLAFAKSTLIESASVAANEQLVQMDLQLNLWGRKDILSGLLALREITLSDQRAVLLIEPTGPPTVLNPVNGGHFMADLVSALVDVSLPALSAATFVELIVRLVGSEVLRANGPLLTIDCDQIGVAHKFFEYRTIFGRLRDLISVRGGFVDQKGLGLNLRLHPTAAWQAFWRRLSSVFRHDR